MAYYNDNFCFIHVPKTAGTSIVHCLSGGTKLHQVQSLRDKNGIPRTGWSDNHYTYYEVEDTFRLLDMKMPKRFFGFIRNPWHRMVSLYNHRLRKPQYNTRRDELKLQEGFKSWLFSTEHRADKILTRKPQLDWFDGSGAYIGLYEELEKDILEDLTGLELYPLKRRNKGHVSVSQYVLFYDTESDEYIRTIFQKDIVYGNYTL